MSGGTSAIVNLYIAIYGHAPSSQTTEALIRAEQVLGITEGDALARFYVVLLHSADRFDDAVGRRTTDEKAFISDLRGVALNLATIVRDVDDAGRKVMRTAKRRGSMLSDDDVVAVDRRRPRYSPICVMPSISPVSAKTMRTASWPHAMTSSRRCCCWL